MRIDTGVREGDEIGVYYDPMIAKLICWDVDRDAALRRLRAALAEYQVVGFTTNLPFLSAVCAHRAFALAHREPGLLDTGLIERYQAELLPEARPASNQILALAVLAERTRIDAEAQAQAARLSAIRGRPGTPATAGASTRTIITPSRSRTASGRWRSRRTIAAAATCWTCPGSGESIGGAVEHARARRDGDLVADLDGARVHASVVRSGRALTVFAFGLSHRLELKEFETVADEDAGGRLTAPMPGSVIDVLVSAGQRVDKGQPLMIIEAMKMEHTIAAPADGVVAEVLFATRRSGEGRRAAARSSRPKPE